MNSHIIKNVLDLLSNQDVASKKTQTLLLQYAGGVVSVDIKLNVDSDLVRNLGCNNLITFEKFTLLLGTDTNMLSYSLPVDR